MHLPHVYFYDLYCTGATSGDLAKLRCYIEFYKDYRTFYSLLEERETYYHCISVRYKIRERKYR